MVVNNSDFFDLKIDVTLLFSCLTVMDVIIIDG